MYYWHGYFQNQGCLVSVLYCITVAQQTFLIAYLCLSHTVLSPRLGVSVKIIAPCYHTCDISQQEETSPSLMPWDANLMVFEKDQFLVIFGSFIHLHVWPETTALKQLIGKQ